MQQMIFIANLIACSTCFRHHYALHSDDGHSGAGNILSKQ